MFLARSFARKCTQKVAQYDVLAVTGNMDEERRSLVLRTLCLVLSTGWCRQEKAGVRALITGLMAVYMLSRY
ncbi:hypothetical protein ACNKHP_08085 [Shigella boydii]